MKDDTHKLEWMTNRVNEQLEELARLREENQRLRDAADAVCDEWQERWPGTVSKETMIKLAEARLTEEHKSP